MEGERNMSGQFFVDTGNLLILQPYQHLNDPEPSRHDQFQHNATPKPHTTVLQLQDGLYTTGWTSKRYISFCTCIFYLNVLSLSLSLPLSLLSGA